MFDMRTQPTGKATNSKEATMGRLSLTGLVAMSITLGTVGPALAQEPEVTLTVHHFIGPTAPTHAAFVEPWARRIEEQSDGRIKVEIYPSMSLGGAPPELYGQARDGVADIVWTLPGYTPGVFPRTEVFELPTVHRGSAEATSVAIQDVFDLIAPDFEDVHPILIYAHAGQALHMVDKPVHQVEDLAGLKLRIPSRTGAMLIEAWGAQPVGMPVPELPQALSRGVVDGALVPYEIVLPLKVHELTSHSIEGPDGRRFGTSVFAFLMNKERYESLPDDLKAIIDANSGAEIAAEFGAVWDDVEIPGKEATIASGSEMLVLDEAAMAGFDERAQQVEERWLQDMEAQGIDGQALLDAAKAAVARHSQTN
jgi:TRAP-type C4-dicarboxylate transport system substrate-binding protein